jgi:hypothetical protein
LHQDLHQHSTGCTAAWHAGPSLWGAAHLQMLRGESLALRYLVTLRWIMGCIAHFGSGLPD